MSPNPPSIVWGRCKDALGQPWGLCEVQKGPDVPHEDMAVDMKIGAKFDWKYTWAEEDVPVMHCFGEVSRRASAVCVLRAVSFVYGGCVVERPRPWRRCCSEWCGAKALLCGLPSMFLSFRYWYRRAFPLNVQRAVCCSTAG